MNAVNASNLIRRLCELRDLIDEYDGLGESWRVCQRLIDDVDAWLQRECTIGVERDLPNLAPHFTGCPCSGTDEWGKSIHLARRVAS